MTIDQVQPIIVVKEMGITHADFYGSLPGLLNDIPYQQNEDTIAFKFYDKDMEIQLEPEGVREVTRSMRLPVTLVNLRFFDFSKEEVAGFIKLFNLKFMKGGG
jgi:hypothetical protein